MNKIDQRIKVVLLYCFHNLIFILLIYTFLTFLFEALSYEIWDQMHASI